MHNTVSSETFKFLNFQVMESQTQSNTYVTRIQHSAIFFPQQVRLCGYLNLDWWYSTLGLNLVSPRTFLSLPLLWGEAEVFRSSMVTRTGRESVELKCTPMSLCPPPLTSMPRSQFLFLSFSLSLHALGFCGSLTLGKPPGETGFCVQRSNF